MSILPPLNRNHVEACSEIPSHISDSDKAFSDSTISNMKAWVLSKKNYKPERVNTISKIAITIIACTAIVCLPKIAAFGSVAVVAFVYHKLAKMVEKKEKDLLLTKIHQKTIEFLSSPDLNKKVLGSLHPYKNDYLLKEIKPDLEALEESSEKIVLMEKQVKVLANQKKIDEALFYLETKGLLGSLERDSASNKNSENTLRFLRDYLDTSRLDLLLEDLSPLINDINENNRTLEEIKEILEGLEGGSFFKKDFLCMNTIILRRQEKLSKKLSALQANGLFFKENEILLNKVTAFVLNTDLNIFNTAKDCRNFIFYSLTGTALIKMGCFLLKEVLSKNKLVDKGMTLTQYTAYPFLLFGLVGVAIGYAYLLELLLSYKNFEPRESIEREKFSKKEKENLQLLEQA